MNLAQFPRRGYVKEPTPIEFLPSFSKALGGKVNIYMKRDDLLPGTGGGNKTRKLDFSIADALAKGQWPFDKEFYIILNQSVGNGSWAADADVTHTYATHFDWVRVYQKKSSSVGAPRAADADVKVTAGDSCINISCNRPTEVTVCDIVGCVVYHDAAAMQVTLPVADGIYIVNGQKVMAR